jgi:hypothetical protein
MNLNPLAVQARPKLYRIFMVDQKVKAILGDAKLMVFISHISSIELPVIKKS